MERKDSVASGITVDREIVVSTGGRDSGYHEKSSLYPPSSVISIAWSMSGQPVPGCQGTRLEPRGATTHPLRPNPVGARQRLATRDGRFAEHLDDDDDDDDDIAAEDDLRQLVDFLRLTPPPSNYMSIPDNLSSSDEEERRRSKLKLFLKRGKSQKRQRPQSITLPDSAVSAKTIGGYRHIAISIPLKYSHFGTDDDNSSQYPVIEPSEPGEIPEIETNLGPLRPRSGDRGVVTVLKPVAEDRESISSNPTSPSQRSEQPERVAALYAPPPPRHVVIPPPEPVRGSSIRDFARRGSTPSPPQKGQGGDPEAGLGLGASPAPLQFSPFGQTARKRSNPRVEPPISRPSSAPPVGSAAESRERIKPLPRSASTRKGKQPELGGMGETLMTPVRTRSRSHHGSVHSSGGNGTGRPDVRRATGSFAESILTSGSEPKVYDAQTARAYASTPIIVGSPSRSESPINTNFPVPPMTRVDSPSRRGSATQLGSKVGNQSRRDRVREKKQRDITESMKGQAAPRPSRSSDIWPESLVPGRSSGSSKTSYARESPGEAAPAAGGPKPKFLHASTLSALGGQPPPGLSASSENSSNLSPTTPSHSLTAADRISLHRRKERRAQREAQQAPRKAWSGNVAWAEQQALADRFDSLREKRFRDMEKRLRRLEGNSDTWFQSMVPLMENLSKLIHDQHIFQQNLSALLSSSGLAAPAAPERPQTAMGRLRGGHGSDLPLRHEILSRSTSAAHAHRASTRAGAHQRPHSIQVPEPGHRTSSLSRSAAGGARHEAETGSASTSTYLTPLQVEFEREMAERRAREARDDEIDARIREAEARRARGGRRRVIVESGDSGGGSDSEDPGRVVETLQPLMRELQGMARDSWSRENLQRRREQEEAEESFALF